MHRSFLACLVISACYSPRLDPCTITCTQGCPPGWDCAGDGYCHETVNEPTCNEGPEPDPTPVIDGGRPFADSGGGKPDATDFDAACVSTPLLVNAGFDLSTGTGSAKVVPNWTHVATGLMIGDLVRTPTEMGAQGTHMGGYAARLGGTSSTDRRLCQTGIIVPPGTDTLRVSGFVWVTTTEAPSAQIFDHLDFTLFTTDAVPVLLETFVTAIDNRMPHTEWTAFAVDAVGASAPYAGQTITLCAIGINDTSFATDLRFDSLVLEAVDCP